MASQRRIIQLTLGDLGLAPVGLTGTRNASVGDEKSWVATDSQEPKSNVRHRKEFPERRELYEEGLGDRKIAEAVGVSRTTIRTWRYQWGLPPNQKGMSLQPFANRLDLYKQGLSDREIAEREDVATKSITHWRLARKLPTNREPARPVKSELTKAFLKDKEEEGLSAGRIQNLTGYLSKFEDFVEKRGKSIREIGPKDVRDFTNSLKVNHRARGTIQHYFTAIQCFYEYTGTYLGVKGPDLRKVKVNYGQEPWEGAGREPYTIDEIQKLVQAAPTLCESLLIEILYWCGLRGGGASNLKISDIDLVERTISVVEKGNKLRTVRYPQHLGIAINRWINVVRKSHINALKSDYFFISKLGTKLSVRQINVIVHKAAVNAGIQKVVATKPDGTRIFKFHTHGIRHTHIAHVRKVGVPEGYISRFVGHESEETTRMYGKPIMQDVFESYEDKFFKNPRI